MPVFDVINCIDRWSVWWRYIRRAAPTKIIITTRRGPPEQRRDKGAGKGIGVNQKERKSCSVQNAGKYQWTINKINLFVDLDYWLKFL